MGLSFFFLIFFSDFPEIDLSLILHSRSPARLSRGVIVPMTAFDVTIIRFRVSDNGWTCQETIDNRKVEGDLIKPRECPAITQVCAVRTREIPSRKSQLASLIASMANAFQFGQTAVCCDGNCPALSTFDLLNETRL